VRSDDRVLLLEHYLARLNRELGREVQGIAPDALQLLLEYEWPGNVREMESVLRQALLHSAGSVLMATALPKEVRPPLVHAANGAVRSTKLPEYENELVTFIAQRIREKSCDLYAEVLERVETELLTQVLQYAGGNQSEAARILGITRGSLRNKIRTLGIAIGQVVSVEGESRAKAAV
jgi:two-component system nitrogen regulation response regulator GlnG